LNLWIIRLHNGFYGFALRKINRAQQFAFARSVVHFICPINALTRVFAFNFSLLFCPINFIRQVTTPAIKMETRLTKLKSDFANITTVRNNIKSIFDTLSLRIDRLKEFYAEFIKTNNQTIFIFGLDSLHF
jgi:hypothetical protein